MKMEPNFSHALAFSSLGSALCCRFVSQTQPHAHERVRSATMRAYSQNCADSVHRWHGDGRTRRSELSRAVGAPDRPAIKERSRVLNRAWVAMAAANYVIDNSALECFDAQRRLAQEPPAVEALL